MLSWVKQQAAGVSETISKDLTEFAAVVQNDTKSLVKTTDSRNDILGYTEKFEEDISTYTTEVTDEGYEDFCPANIKSLASETLEKRVRVNTFYYELVPDTVSESDFWKRYFFRLDKLQKEEERKKLLREIEEKEKKNKKQDASDEWIDCSNTDREELATLLAESRRECKALKEKLISVESELKKYKEQAGETTEATEATEISEPEEQPKLEEESSPSPADGTSGDDKSGDWDTLANW